MHSMHSDYFVDSHHISDRQRHYHLWAQNKQTACNIVQRKLPFTKKFSPKKFRSIQNRQIVSVLSEQLNGPYYFLDIARRLSCANVAAYEFIPALYRDLVTVLRLTNASKSAELCRLFLDDNVWLQWMRAFWKWLFWRISLLFCSKIIIRSKANKCKFDFFFKLFPIVSHLFRFHSFQYEPVYSIVQKTNIACKWPHASTSFELLKIERLARCKVRLECVTSVLKKNRTILRFSGKSNMLFYTG